MTGTWQDGHVRVRRLPSGLVRIGPYMTAAAGLARLNLPGATALVDPLTPHCIPTLEVSDASEADEVVRALFGATVGEQVLALDRTQLPVADLEFVQGPQLRDLQRLGHLLWLGRTAPWPMPSAVLVAELITATDACLDVLENPAAAVEAIAGYAGSMQTALFAAVAGQTSPPVLARLVDAGRAIARTLPVTDAARPPLLAAIAAAAALSRPFPGLAPRPSPLVDACTQPAAAHAGVVVDGILYTGSASAEWSRNSVGIVSRDEAGVTWTVETQLSAGVEVTVVASRALPEPHVCDPDMPPTSADALIRAVSDVGWVSARVAACSFHTPAWPLPLVEVLLTPYPATGDLTGSGSVHGPAAVALHAALRYGTVVVDVHDAGHRHAHLARTDPTVEAARRWTARALCASRLALTWPEDTAARAARGAWNRALALWRHTGQTGSRELALDRVRHCTAWLSLLTGENQPTLPTPADLADSITASDIGDPGTVATLSEVLAAGRVLDL